MTNFTPHISPLGRRSTAALAAAMILVPATAQAKPVDTVGGAAQQAVVTSKDLRSPDARDAAQQAVVTSKDLRSPDARDAAQPTPAVPGVGSAKHIALAQERSYASYGDPKPITTVQTGTPASDFDWPSAGIGAGIAMAIALLGVTAFALTHRRPGRGVLFS